MTSKQVKKLNAQVTETLSKPLAKAPAKKKVVKAATPTAFVHEPGMPGFKSF